jgi:hypothetical protein
MNLYREGLHSNGAILISASVFSPRILPKFVGSCLRKKRREKYIINKYIFIFLEELLEMASIFTDTNKSSV